MTSKELLLLRYCIDTDKDTASAPLMVELPSEEREGIYKACVEKTDWEKFQVILHGYATLKSRMFENLSVEYDTIQNCEQWLGSVDRWQGKVYFDEITAYLQAQENKLVCDVVTTRYFEATVVLSTFDLTAKGGKMPTVDTEKVEEFVREILIEIASKPLSQCPKSMDAWWEMTQRIITETYEHKQHCIIDDEVADVVTRLLASQNQRNVGILKRHLAGEKYMLIGKDEGITRSRVKEIVENLKRVVREKIEAFSKVGGDERLREKMCRITGEVYLSGEVDESLLTDQQKALRKPIEQCDFSTRTKVRMLNCGFTNLGDIAKAWEKLPRYSFVGDKMISEIKSVLESHGISVGVIGENS